MDKVQTLQIRTSAFTMTWWALSKRYLYCLTVVFFCFTSCEQSGDIGLGLGNFNEVGVIFTDTIPVEASTILLDSVVTNRGDLLMVGQYQDPKFGKVTAQSYLQLIPLIDTLSLQASNPVVDSVVLVIPQAYVYGKTTGNQSIEIYRITGNFNDSLSFNSSTVEVNNTILNTGGIAKQVNTQTIIDQIEARVNLQNTLGEELLTLIQNNEGQSTSILDFSEFFKGLLISPSTNDDAAIIGLSSLSQNLRLNIYYHQDGESEGFNFQFFPNVIDSFSNIQVDKTGTLLEDLTLTNTLNTDKTGNELYLQSGVGIVPKISFPSLQNFVDNNNIIINSAFLVIYPAELESEEFPYPTSLTLLELDEQDMTIRDINNNWQFVQSNGLNPFINGSPITFQYDQISNSFRAEITLQLQLMLNGQKNVSSLAITERNDLIGTSANAIFNQISTRRFLIKPFDDKTTDNKHLKLELFYTQVQDN